MRSSSIAASAWARVLTLVVAMLTTLVVADVKFSEPSAGANLTAGQIDVRWEDSGINPPISELTQYTLSLMIGGNDLNDMVCVPPADTYVRGDKANLVNSNLWRLLSLKVHTLPGPRRVALFLRVLLPMCQMACMLIHHSLVQGYC
jgi:hypothetical protein